MVPLNVAALAWLAVAAAFDGGAPPGVRRTAGRMWLDRVPGEAAPLATGSERLTGALSGMSDAQRYNVVLQGMLVRAKSKRGVLEGEVWPLLEEMAAGGTLVGGRRALDIEARVALVDAAAAVEDCVAMERSLRLARRLTDGLSRYASEQVTLPPSDPRRRTALLETLPPLPADDRRIEAAAAVGVLGTSVTSVLWVRPRYFFLLELFAYLKVLFFAIHAAASLAISGGDRCLRTRLSSPCLGWATPPTSAQSVSLLIRALVFDAFVITTHPSSCFWCLCDHDSSEPLFLVPL
jgi:hypothetical protein